MCSETVEIVSATELQRRWKETAAADGRMLSSLGRGAKPQCRRRRSPQRSDRKTPRGGRIGRQKPRGQTPPPSPRPKGDTTLVHGQCGRKKLLLLNMLARRDIQESSLVYSIAVEILLDTIYLINNNKNLDLLLLNNRSRVTVLVQHSALNSDKKVQLGGVILCLKG